MTIGDNLRNAREKKGLTQEELAKILEVTKATISRYENNVREPNLAIISKLAETLKVSINELIEDNYIAIPTKINFVDNMDNTTTNYDTFIEFLMDEHSINLNKSEIINFKENLENYVEYELYKIKQKKAD